MVRQNHKKQENILHIKNDTMIHSTETGSHFHWQSFCSMSQYICYSHHEEKRKKKDVNKAKIKKHPNIDKHLTQASFVLSYEHRDCALFLFSRVNTKQPK